MPHQSLVLRARYMLPVNPRDLQKQLRQLKKLGVKIEQIEGAKNASIELRDKKLILENPEVFVVEFGGAENVLHCNQRHT
uniref:NAC-A/B domain-containing protein n=1 Tax=Ignisphaera aggregans TaxID=334771 RepID=A0A7C2ZBI2_9CREN